MATPKNISVFNLIAHKKHEREYCIVEKESVKMTNFRWFICMLMFFATMVNYLDRQVLSLTWKDFIAPEFHWTDTDYGYITAVDFQSYMLPPIFLRDGLSTGWEHAGVICGQFSYGRQEPACMLYAGGSQNSPLGLTVRPRWCRQPELRLLR